MAASAACFDVPMDGASLAAACQWAENHVAGAPCGIMDQMTSALGRRDRLLRLRCQPATVETRRVLSKQTLTAVRRKG